MGSWGEQISDSDFLAKSAALSPLIVGVCGHSQSGADADHVHGIMAILLMVMMIVLVMVTTVPETLRQVEWRCQC